MDFNKHFNLEGQHAYLSASKYHWMHYDDDKFDAVYMAHLAAKRGTELHNLAHQLIRLGVKVSSPKTLKLYVNDAIGYRMSPEQVLYYSENSFGTADAISFRQEPRKKVPTLRVHDLKTGINVTSEHQLEVYAALFCLEYRYKPTDIEIELRIYQNDEVRVYEANPIVVSKIMDRIVSFDKRIAAMKIEASQ